MCPDGSAGLGCYTTGRTIPIVLTPVDQLLTNNITISNFCTRLKSEGRCNDILNITGLSHGEGYTMLMLLVRLH